MSMHPNLSFDQAPPISVPFRFLLTAPLFGIVAGLLLFWLGPTALESRWSPGALALTHLLTVGLMLQVMCGGLLQFVPVVTGGNVWRPQLIAGILHPALIGAALLLVLAFQLGKPVLFQWVVPVFAVSLGTFIVVVGQALLRTPSQGRTIYTLRLALLGLLLTLLLGLALAGMLAWPGEWLAAWSLPHLVNVHLGWGLGGWAMLLLAGVSYQVVPMFQITPQFPLWLTRLLPAGLCLRLLLWSAQAWPGVQALAGAWQVLLFLPSMAVLLAYGLVTLQLQQKRRRRVVDTTFLFWRVAMIALLAFVLLWLLGSTLPSIGSHVRWPFGLAGLLLLGVFVSAINGMLYKIVPFLIWLHLQRLGNLKELPPNIKQIIPEKAMQGQFWLHVATLLVFLLASVWPLLSEVAGLAFAASCAWLEWNLYGALKAYLDFKRRTLKDRTHAVASFHAP